MSNRVDVMVREMGEKIKYNAEKKCTCWQTDPKKEEMKTCLKN